MFYNIKANLFLPIYLILFIFPVTGVLMGLISDE